MDAGFILNNKTAGNRLIGDCIAKLVINQSVQNPSTGQNVQQPTGANPTACATNIHHGGTPTTGMTASSLTAAQKTFGAGEL
jgi:hypothetical protein